MEFSELKSKINNIVLFVSDSLRWDYTPKLIKTEGKTFKTIASSLYTASSFPSIFTGQYPPKHGVYTWAHTLPSWNRGLLDVPSFNVSLRCETTWTSMGPEDSQIHKTCGDPSGTKLSELKEPFIYIEDDKGGHCPYGFEFSRYAWNCPEFFAEYGKKPRSKLIAKYKHGIKNSINNFNKRIKVLKDRGIDENTLVIFTSDHGELLGEYGGLVAHGRPPCPELVYVPTTFIHPEIKGVIEKNIIRHVDIYPTIMDILGKQLDSEFIDGVNIFENKPEIGLSIREGGYQKAEGIKKYFNYKAHSVWNKKGGYVFHKFNNIKFRLLFLSKIFKGHPEFNYLNGSVKNKNLFGKIRSYKTAIDHLCDPVIKYGDPNFDEKKARILLNKYMANYRDNKEKMRIKSTLTNLKI